MRRARARLLAASEPTPQCGQVRSQDGEVVGSPAERLRRDALERLEVGDSRVGLARDGSCDAGRRQGLRVDGGRAARADARDDTRELPWRRFGLGVQTLDGDLAKAVALGEVPEGGMAGDDVAASAVR